MERHHLAVVLLCASCLVLGSLVINSFVTYAPTVKASQIQNFYIESILWHIAGAVLLQLTAAGLLYFSVSKRKENPSR